MTVTNRLTSALIVALGVCLFSQSSLAAGNAAKYYKHTVDFTSQNKDSECELPPLVYEGQGSEAKPEVGSPYGSIHEVARHSTIDKLLYTDVADYKQATLTMKGSFVRATKVNTGTWSLTGTSCAGTFTNKDLLQ